MKTLKEVLQETGISYHTLVKYSGMGLIPKPKRVWRGRKGSQSLYANKTIGAINRIKLKQGDGLTLREINKELQRLERTSMLVTTSDQDKMKVISAFFDMLTKGYPGEDFHLGNIFNNHLFPRIEIRKVVWLMFPLENNRYLSG